MARRRRKRTVLGALLNYLFGGPDVQPEHDRKQTLERRRRREQKAGVREQKVRERGAARRQRSETRQQRERQQRERRQQVRESARDARAAAKLERQRERAIRGWMSAGLTRTEAEAEVDREHTFQDIENPRRQARRVASHRGRARRKHR